MKPTREDLDKAIDVLHWVSKDTRDNEPHAVSTIDTLDEAAQILQSIEV